MIDQSIVVIMVPSCLERRIVVKGLRHAYGQPQKDTGMWWFGRIVVVQSGMGPVNAKRCIENFQARMQMGVIRQMWLVGVCGGLRADLKPGDLILADSSIGLSPQGEVSQEFIVVDDAVRDSVACAAKKIGHSLTIGPVATTSHPLIHRADKQVAAKSGAIAVEMEAGPLVEYAHGQSNSLIHLRVVMDPENSGPILASKPWTAIEGGLGFRKLRHLLLAGRTLKRVISVLAETGGPFEKVTIS